MNCCATSIVIDDKITLFSIKSPIPDNCHRLEGGRNYLTSCDVLLQNRTLYKGNFVVGTRWSLGLLWRNILGVDLGVGVRIIFHCGELSGCEDTRKTRRGKGKERE